jgi:hypothetical protein
MKKIILVFAFLFVSQAHSTTYYVDRLKPGIDSNNGTSEATPFFTIKKCVDVINAIGIEGDSCLVKNGNYPEPWTIWRSGTSTSPITIKAFPGHTPTIKFQTTDPTTLMTPPNTGYRIQVYGTKTSPIGWVVIEGFEIINGYNGLYCDYCHNTVFRRISCHHQYLGCFGGRGKDVTIDRAKIYHNGRFAECIAFPNGGGPTKNADGSNLNVCNQDQAVYAAGARWTISNSVIYDQLAYAIQIADYAPEQGADPDYGWANGWRVYNNTFAYSVQRMPINYGCYTSTTVNTIIENNIFFQNCNASWCPGYPNRGAVEACSSSTTNIIRKNVVYNRDGISAPVSCSYASCTNGVNYTAIDNKSGIDPNFENAPATGLPAFPNFSLKLGSVAIDFGSNLFGLGIKTDFLGVARPSSGPFDAGAFEFGSTPTIPAPLPPKNLTVN